MRKFIPTPSSSTLELGFFTFHFYALTILLGIVVAIWLTKRRYSALGGDANEITDLAFVVGDLEIGELHQLAAEEPVAHRSHRVVERQRGGDGDGRVVAGVNRDAHGSGVGGGEGAVADLVVETESAGGVAVVGVSGGSESHRAAVGL